MRSYKDRGIILKIKQFREADKLVIILGEKHGRIEAVAKGAGKLLSKKTGVIDLLNLGNFSFHKTKGIDLLLEAELLEDYKEVKSNLSSISDVFYLLEIIDKFWLGEGNESNFYNETIEFLNLFKDSSINKDLLITGIEIRLLDLSGFTPLLNRCIHCRDKLVANEPRIAAASGEAGYMCKKHFSQNEMNNLLVPDSLIKIQKYIMNNTFDSLRKLNVTSTQSSRLRSIQKTWLEGILEHRLKSAQFIQRVK